jgi:SAM-dependent methyltransferase
MPGGVPPAGVLAALDRPADADLARLLELFCQGDTLERLDVERAVDSALLPELIDAGVVEIDGDGVRSRVIMASLNGVIVAGDREWGELASVTGLSPAANAVAYTTVRRDIRAALDVGTGSGVQALLTAQHAERVLGTDINGHALSLASLNQHLNAVSNVTWIEGNWFEPARGERFDLVVANPPVVVSPDTSILARDSAVGAAELLRQLLRQSADHLVDGGFATVLCNWPHRVGGWEEAPREWVAGLPCDSLLIRFGSHDPVFYAMSHVFDRRHHDPDLAAETVKRWSDHYQSTGAERIAVGVVVLRRRDAGPPWIRAFEADGSPTGPAGDQLERMFAAGDFVASRSGPQGLRALLSTAWRLVDGHRLEQALVHENGAYATGPAVLRREPGLRVSAGVDPRAVPLINACDGLRPLGRLVSEIPAPDGLDQAAFQQICLSAVRDLIARGYLVGDGWPGDVPGRQTGGDAAA